MQIWMGAVSILRNINSSYNFMHLNTLFETLKNITMIKTYLIDFENSQFFWKYWVFEMQKISTKYFNFNEIAQPASLSNFTHSSNLLDTRLHKEITPLQFWYIV